MNTETRVWNLLALVVGVLTASAPLFVGLEQLRKGNVPEKKIELFWHTMINPLGDLSALGSTAKLRLQISDATYDNIAIRQFRLTNVGAAPVTAADFHKPLSVSVDPPWTIISIENDDSIVRSFPLEWDQEASNRFVAKPFLLNPGDAVYQTIYLTNTDPMDFEKIRNQKYLQVDTKLDARIVNLREFSEPPSLMERHGEVIGPVVYLELPATILLIIIASTILYWYIYNLVIVGIARHPSRKAYLLFILAALLSYATAEVIVYYVFGGQPAEDIWGRDLLNWRSQWQNWVIMLIHVSASMYLYRRLKSMSPEAL